MTPGRLLETLASTGIRLQIKKGFLRCQGRRSAYTDELRGLVEEHRQTLIEDWRCWECGRITNVLYGIGRAVRCRECAKGEGQ